MNGKPGRFGHWIPGVDAYESFKALLEAEYESVLEENEREANRITPYDDAAVVTGKLPYLIQQIETDINFLAPEDAPRTDHPAYEFNLAQAEGLQEVLDRVVEIQKTHTDPDSIRKALATLVQEYQTRQADAQQSTAEGNDLLQEALSPNASNIFELMGRMMEFSSQHMKLSGNMQAIAKIMFYLKS